ncbi:sucrose-specific PTS transporter subunit IIBC [Clostridium nigeriense]|uniref:sucrose-specific PTS transporter subunit IIBC n=1 Tax=Clostridium nigeriense TaxID=1805470 RepID=UPI003D32988F
MDYKDIAREVLEAIGGKENVVGAAHCATRLRLVLNDIKKINQKEMDQIEAVKGTFENDGQYQIILGPGVVDEVYKQFIKMTNIESMTKKEVKEVAKNKVKNPILRLVNVLSDIFVPLIPAIVAGGLLMGINNVLTVKDLFGPMSVVEMYPGISDLVSMINTIASASFTYLPVLIGFSAAKRFGGNPFLGATLGMIMVHPDLLNAYGYSEAVLNNEVPVWNILGGIEKVGYQGTVLPILAATFVLTTIEKICRKYIPQVLDNLLTPLITVFVTAFLTFTIIGPITRSAGDGLTYGIVWLWNTTGALGAGIFGSLYSVIVITGLHQSFTAVSMQLIADINNTGGDIMGPICSMANVAQGAAAMAVFFVNKNKKMKAIASSSSISALLGITEPAIFGVNLKLKYPFICAMIGSGISCAIVGKFNILASAMGVPAGLPGFIAVPVGKYIPFGIAMLVSFVVSFTLTIIVDKYLENKNKLQHIN